MFFVSNLARAIRTCMIDEIDKASLILRENEVCERVVSHTHKNVRKRNPLKKKSMKFVDVEDCESSPSNSASTVG